jgi:hypothetical protein
MFNRPKWPIPFLAFPEKRGINKYKLKEVLFCCQYYRQSFITPAPKSLQAHVLRAW